ncbi:MAG: class I SAM-dependent methyltransferase [Spirochaetia bacterium]
MRKADDVERFDRWAATYDRSLAQRFFFMPIHSRMLGLLERAGPEDHSPGFVLDVGCGTGRLLRAAALRWPGARLFGVDPAPQMIAEAARLNPSASFSLAPAESLPFPDRTADIVFTSMSFHHWADQAKGIREIARVLRPGGFFCLADHAFFLARLSGERVRSRSETHALVTGEGLAVLNQRALLPFLLVTVAQKPSHS